MDVRPTDPAPGPDGRGRARPLAESLTELLRLHAPRLLVIEDDRELEPIVRAAAASLRPEVAVDWSTGIGTARRLLRLRYYDAVLADYQLDDGAVGLSLRADCRELQPQAVFAMTSAYALPDYLHSVGRNGTPFLEKPFDARTCRRFLSSLVPREGVRDRR